MDVEPLESYENRKVLSGMGVLYETYTGRSQNEVFPAYRFADWNETTSQYIISSYHVDLDGVRITDEVEEETDAPTLDMKPFGRQMIGWSLPGQPDVIPNLNFYKAPFEVRAMCLSTGHIFGAGPGGIVIGAPDGNGGFSFREQAATDVSNCIEYLAMCKTRNGVAFLSQDGVRMIGFAAQSGQVSYSGTKLISDGINESVSGKEMLSTHGGLLEALEENREKRNNASASVHERWRFSFHRRKNILIIHPPFEMRTPGDDKSPLGSLCCALDSALSRRAVRRSSCCLLKSNCSRAS